MYSRKLLFLIFSCLIKFAAAQDTCNLRISLLTCSPGEELYSTFGHSAFRVTNTVSGEDIVYNYGTFNFEEPGFYTKFIRGKLLYYLSTEDFPSFAELYQQQNRSMTEQVINFTCEEKDKVLASLRTNLLPQNRAYKYDFLFDNCTTRLRDLAENTADSTIHFGKIVPERTRFRDLIHLYLNNNQQHWSKLGIDLLLGSRTDAVMTNRQAMFLPDYLLMGFDNALAGRKKLVAGKTTLFKSPINNKDDSLFTQPIFFSTLLLVIIILFSVFKNEGSRNWLRNFDAMLMFLVGMLGSLILFMWFGTDHVMCADNYNLLWAWPTHAIVAFFINRNNTWVKKYLVVMLMVYSLLLLAWFFLPQKLNIAMFPIVLIMIIRTAIRLDWNRKLKVQKTG